MQQEAHPSRNKGQSQAPQGYPLHRQRGFFVRRTENAYHLMISDPGPWQMGYAFTPGEEPHALMELSEAEFYLEIPDGRRPYFLLRGPEGPDLWAADIRVEAPRVENLRDMGGYLTEAGRVVRWGRFFRGGALVDLEDSDRQVVAGLNLRYVLDYRSRSEVSRKPDEIMGDTVYLHRPAIQSTNPKVNSLAEADMAKEIREAAGPEQIREVLDAFVLLYRELPFGNEAYRDMLGILDDLETGSMLQHCSAGKDRTGVGCALLLLALGASEETAMQDYLLSTVFRYHHNRRFLEQLAQFDLPPAAVDALTQMLRVSPELLGASFSEIKARYGGYERFFLEEYGIDRAHLDHWRQIHTIPGQ